MSAVTNLFINMREFETGFDAMVVTLEILRRKIAEEGFECRPSSPIHWFGSDDDIDNMRFYTDEIGYIAKYVLAKRLREGYHIDQIAVVLGRKFPEFDIDGFIDTELRRFENAMRLHRLSALYGSTAQVAPTLIDGDPDCELCLQRLGAYREGVAIEDAANILPCHPGCHHVWTLLDHRRETQPSHRGQDAVAQDERAPSTPVLQTAVDYDKRQIYRAALKQALDDGLITSDERAILERLRETLQISDLEHDEIINEMLPMGQLAFYFNEELLARILAADDDSVVSPDEEDMGFLIGRRQRFGRYVYTVVEEAISAKYSRETLESIDFGVRLVGWYHIFTRAVDGLPKTDGDVLRYMMTEPYQCCLIISRKRPSIACYHWKEDTILAAPFAVFRPEEAYLAPKRKPQRATKKEGDTRTAVPTIVDGEKAFQISDIFLIYHDGCLISYVTSGSGLKGDMDSDIVSGMLTAINNFVADTFETSGGMIKTLQYGQFNIYIERGVQMYLACVFSGEPKGNFRWKMRKILIDIWDEYKVYLKHWSGDVNELEGIDDMLRELIVHAE